MKLIRYLLIVIITVLAVNMISADDGLLLKAENLEKKLEAEPEDGQLLFDLGSVYLEIAAYGASAEKAGRKALKYLTRAYDILKTPLAKSFMGSAWLVLARDTINPITKLDAVSKGIRYIDESVDDHPRDILVRWLRIESTIDLPDIFERDKLLDTDINFILKKYKKDPELINTIIDPAQVYLYKALVLKKKKKLSTAFKYAKNAEKIAVDEAVKLQIAEFLDLYKE